MAKQTFTTGQVLTAAQMTSLQETAMTGGPASTKTVSYVLVAADAGTRVAMNAAGATTITVNTGLFSAGDTVSIQNIGAGVCTVTAGTATVNTSGSLVLAQYQGGILYFTSASAAIFFQFATPASGDIEGVTAGTGISGGGTSGTVTITNSMATEITAKGDLIVGTGNATFDNLPAGTNGYTLVADSAQSTGLKWQAPAGGGKVLQVVTAFKSDTFTTTSTSYTDITGLSVSITPTLATSKIYVIVNVTGAGTQGQAPGMVQLLRGATVIGNGDTAGSRTSGFAALGRSGGATEMASAVINFLDSPATTSATTYKIQGNALIAGNTLFINRCESTTDDASRVRGSSTITVLEIGA